MSSSNSTPLATVAVISIGQMGLGIASLLKAHNYRIITNVSSRSTVTQDRARSADIELLPTDEKIVEEADYILSIVPPRDAIATAQRIGDAYQNSQSTKSLYYLDLNAISPSTTRKIAEILGKQAPEIRFVDGGIIGGPPSYNSERSSWTKPDIPLSSPHALHSAPTSGAHLADTLSTRHLGPEIGKASGLKCCFAALSKGFTALAIQSFSTASSLGVYDELQEYLAKYNPSAGERARKGVVGCTSKAYRWVEEMNQIGEAFGEEGGWEGRARVFREIAGVFEGLASVVEKEGLEGMGDAEGVVRKLGEGLRKDG